MVGAGLEIYAGLAAHFAGRLANRREADALVTQLTLAFGADARFVVLAWHLLTSTLLTLLAFGHDGVLGALVDAVFAILIRGRRLAGRNDGDTCLAVLLLAFGADARFVILAWHLLTSALLTLFAFGHDSILGALVDAVFAILVRGRRLAGRDDGDTCLAALLLAGGANAHGLLFVGDLFVLARLADAILGNLACAALLDTLFAVDDLLAFARVLGSVGCLAVLAFLTGSGAASGARNLDLVDGALVLTFAANQELDSRADALCPVGGRHFAVGARDAGARVGAGSRDFLLAFALLDALSAVLEVRLWAFTRCTSLIWLFAVLAAGVVVSGPLRETYGYRRLVTYSSHFFGLLLPCDTLI
jgi:hypothetical protein